MARKTRKTDKCPSCCPDGGAIFKKDHDYEDGQFVPYWYCLNCGHRKYIKTRKTWEPHTINSRQQRTLDRLQRTLPLLNGDDYEWKKWDVVTTDYGPVWLDCEHGRKGDEGTLAELIARDRWHILIKTGGGTEVHYGPKWSKGKRV